MKKSKIIYLIGYPGVGKLSIAKNISKQTNFTTIDNHSINNIFFKVDFKDKDHNIPDFVWDAIDETWDILFSTYKKNKNPMNLIFTNALFKEKEFSHKLFKRINEFAEYINADLHPVVIKCNWKEHKNRINTPERESNFKITSESFAKQIIEENSLLIPDHKNTIILDNSTQSPEEIANQIIKKVT